MLKVRTLLVASAGTGFAIGAYARFVEPRRLETRDVHLRLPSWPRKLDGLRLGLVGDIHSGFRRGRVWPSPAVEAAAEAIRRQAPDLLLLAGDYGFMRWDPAELAAIVDTFRAPVRVAIDGNHDWAHGSARLSALRGELESRGIRFLVNEVASLEVRGVTLTVAGLADCHAKRADIPAVVEQLAGRAGPTILMSHSPDAVRDVPPECFDLALSGHTHGGQLAVPFMERRVVRRFAHTSYDRGFYNVNDRPLFVTKGVGLVGYQARFRARPEVVVLTIRAPAEKETES